MDLRAEILKEHSKAQSLKIAGWIGKDKQRFTQLVGLFLHDEYRVVQRSAWVLSTVGQRYPALIQPHIARLVQRMNDPGVHVAAKRNVVRVLQFLEIPKAIHANVINTCFNFLADPKETVAVRCFSMTVLDNLSKHYPDIRQELKAVIQNQLEHAPTAGFISRARKILK